MVSVPTKETTTSTPVETKKQRKKQAKHEARMLLKAEQAKKDVQKAERRVAKAQSNLETCNAYLRQLEQSLLALRTHHEESSENLPIPVQGSQDTLQETNHISE